MAFAGVPGDARTLWKSMHLTWFCLRKPDMYLVPRHDFVRPLRPQVHEYCSEARCSRVQPTFASKSICGVSTRKVCTSWKPSRESYAGCASYPPAPSDRMHAHVVQRTTDM